MKFLPTAFKIWLLKLLYKDIASLGYGGDTELAHINKWESNLLMAHGGSGTLNATTGLREYKGGSPQQQTTTSEIDPMLKPYISYGLDEAKNLYEAGAPDYYPGDTYIPASSTTTSALDAIQSRALGGNPLLPAAQAQQLGSIQGDYLSAGNPYFSSMMSSAAKPVISEYNKATQNLNSTASQAGRYGSNAQAQMQSDATTNLADALSRQGAQLAYQNYGQERGFQNQAVANAPQLAQADYGDIQQLMNVGKVQEDYSRQALDSDINRYQYGANAPQQQLGSYLSAAYGAPAPINSTTTTSGGGK